jgi:hypothetical protein
VKSQRSESSKPCRNRQLGRAYTGLAIVANHQAISARLERGAERILRLFREGKEQEAIALMAHPQWGEPVPGQA